MRALRSLLISFSAALVAVPMAPCAILAGNCAPTAQARQHAAEQPVAEHSCCSHRENGPPHAAHPKPVAPCEMACCAARTVAKPVEKVGAIQPFDTVALLPAQEHVTIVAGVVLPGVAPPAFRSLQILHCLWRC